MIIGLITISQFVARIIVLSIALIRFKWVREELGKSITSDFPQTIQSIDYLYWQAIKSHFWLYIAALVVTAVLLYLKAFRGGTVLEQNDHEGGYEDEETTRLHQAVTDLYEQNLDMVQRELAKAIDDMRASLKETITRGVREIVDAVNKAYRKDKLIIGLLIVLSIIGIAMIVYLKRRGVSAHIAVETLRSAGLSAKSPVIVGVCIVGVLAIAVAVYFIYRKKV